MVVPLIIKEQIHEDDLLGLIGEPSENQWVDIKRSIYPKGIENTEKQDIWKTKLCDDISAFANADGGIIVLGMTETNGSIAKLNGLELGVNIDEEIKKMKQVADSRINPLVPGLRFQPVKLSNSDTAGAIVIQIPRSYAAPHRVDTTKQFKIRRSNGNSDMSMDELRMAFNLTESYVERIRKFRRERIAAIAQQGHEDIPVTLPDGVKLTLQLVPLRFSEPGNSIDLSQNFFSKSLPIRINSISWDMRRYNLDGVYITLNYDEAVFNYIQLYRSGIIEEVAAYDRDKLLIEYKMTFRMRWIEEGILEFLQMASNMMQTNFLQPPFVLMITLTGTRGSKAIARLAQNNFINKNITSPEPINKEQLLFPEVIITDFHRDMSHLKRFMKPTFDMIWNACGWATSSSYDKNGEWINPDY